MRAAVLRTMGAPAPYADSRPLAIETVVAQPPGPGEVRVRVRAAGLCHSDLSVIDGSRPRPMPMLLGHEAAGEVVEAGDGVSTLRVGDRVVFSFVPMCGHCAPCACGRPVLCEPGAAANARGTLLGGAMRLHDAGCTPLHHHLGVSGFAEYAVVSEHSAVRVDADLPPKIAALFGCAVMTGVGAVVNTAGVRPGESVAVFGLGGVGLSALLGAAASSAWPLVAVDVVPAKLALARELGASHCIDAREGDVAAQVREATGGGADYSIETAGHAHVLATAYAATRRGGSTISVGLPAPDRMFSVPAVSLVAEERTVKGSYMGSAVPRRDIPRYVALYRAGRLPVDRLLTHTLALDGINAGFDRLASGEAIRQVVLFD
ncbi:alcohol dehydrogenase catalytic domain-containing protein [Luteimonas viscosa]|uniref:Alcohol dehydrogenase catalytic domain-containing protein n=1 Tax=Luteimonas viscosa TaxID=1132694 RepID=A0A5D4XST2_9GAMM|nr:zinc-dependent alcohol dehydrogenase family protein [Luteimonas viscosa]TYT27646.1 alcohol dehydrogenase catalytic domain-containing protein [Luteimonas viscosa]